jgi:cell division septation protein DedD
MKKIVIILTCLLSVIFAGSFLLSRGLKKAKFIGNSPAVVTHKQDKDSGDGVKSVFYESVGASPKPSFQNRIKQASRFTIELANFTEREDAETLLLQLKSRGIEGFYTPMRRGGQVIYRVRLGMFTNSDDAQKVLAKVNSAAKVNGVVAKLQ